MGNTGIVADTRVVVGGVKDEKNRSLKNMLKLFKNTGAASKRVRKTT